MTIHVKGVIRNGIGILMYAAGSIAAAVLLWQVAALALAVTIGPGAPMFSPPLYYQRHVVAFSVPVVLATAWGAAVRRSRPGRVDAALIIQVGGGVVALGLSYRFPALLLLLGIFVCRI